MSKVFISYSHKDEEWIERLYAQLRRLQFEDEYEVWSDRDIYPGEDWKTAITRAIQSSQVFVLLISPNYLSSDFVLNFEVPSMIDFAKKNNTAILPIVVSPTSKHYLINKYQFLNSNEKALNSLSKSELDSFLADVAEKIYKILKSKKLAEDSANYVQDDPHDIAINKAVSTTGGFNPINISGSTNIFNIADENLRKGRKDE